MTYNDNNSRSPNTNNGNSWMWILGVAGAAVLGAMFFWGTGTSNRTALNDSPAANTRTAPLNSTVTPAPLNSTTTPTPAPTTTPRPNG